MKKGYFYLLTIVFVQLLASCSTTKYVPEGSYLLDKVKIYSDDKRVESSSLRTYIRQNPNPEWFNLFRTQLYLYDLSSRHSKSWFNKTLRRIGSAPVIYDEKQAIRTQQELQKAVRNQGFWGATVDRTTEQKNKKLKLIYRVHTGQPYIVHTIRYDIKDPKLEPFITKDKGSSLLKDGMIFDANVLDAERQRITNILLRKGYYKFNKNYIAFTADTVKNSYSVDLTMHLFNENDSLKSHKCYYINSVKFIADYNILESSATKDIHSDDSIHYQGIPIYYKHKLFLRPEVLTDNLDIEPGELYDEQHVQKTFSNFHRLSAIKYTNILFSDTLVADSAKLNCYVMLTKNKPKSIAFELGGTNSAGDLGVAASTTFQNRNLFHGSESFMMKFSGAYEAISGLQAGYTNNNYTEYGVETNVNFPDFLFPFLSSDFRKTISATTQFGLQYNYQLRPEFSRTLASASWSYIWSRPHVNNRLDIIDVAFLYLPWISSQFKEDYIDKGQSYIFEYNYKNRLIVHTGYTYNYNSSSASPVNNTTASNSYSIRISLESAGNLLYGLSKIFNVRKNSDNEYSLLNIPFAQYLKGECDYARNITVDPRNSFAFHFNAGLAVPYGNAKSIPFEKQFFAGGANNVRGWGVRELGPGSFPGDGNLMDQSGDIKLNASVEYRSKMFWKLEGAAFVDAGNIWTIRSYDNQPGGLFKFDKFYKQIAVAYGLGLRLNLDFFVLRFDGGMKALNPVYSSGRNRYPIFHPNFGRDFAFHFAVGYPF